MRGLFSMNLNAMVLGAAFACAEPKPVCYHAGESLSCIKEDGDLIQAYSGGFLIGNTRDHYCVLTIGLRSSDERTHYIDYGCDETVDECVYESSKFGSSTENSFAVGDIRRARSSFGGSYDSFFKRKKEELLEGKK